MNLTLAEIKSRPIVKARPVFVEDWGGDVHVKRLNTLEHARFQALVKTDPPPLVDFVLLFAANEDGTALFSEDDRAFLEDTPMEVLETIFMAGVELLSSTRKARDDAKN